MTMEQLLRNHLVQNTGIATIQLIEEHDWDLYKIKNVHGDCLVVVQYVLKSKYEGNIEYIIPFHAIKQIELIEKED